MLDYTLVLHKVHTHTRAHTHKNTCVYPHVTNMTIPNSQPLTALCFWASTKGRLASSPTIGIHTSTVTAFEQQLAGGIWRWHWSVLGHTLCQPYGYGRCCSFQLSAVAVRRTWVISLSIKCRGRRSTANHPRACIRIVPASGSGC